MALVAQIKKRVTGSAMKRSASGADESPPNKRSALGEPVPAEVASTALAESKVTPKRLLGELKLAQKAGLDPHTQLRIGLIDDSDVYRWKCEKVYTNSEHNTPQQQRIYEGLQKMGKDTFEYHLIFNDEYPFKPPFVYLHHPILLPGTNVFPGGGVCAQQISQQKNNGWSPALNVKTLMVALTTLPETYPDVNVRPGDYDGNTEESARKDWVRIEKAHPVWPTNKTRS